MISHCVMKSVRMLFTAILITMLTVSLLPARMAHAQAPTTSDLPADPAYRGL